MECLDYTGDNSFEGIRKQISRLEEMGKMSPEEAECIYIDLPPQEIKEAARMIQSGSIREKALSCHALYNFGKMRLLGLKRLTG